MNVMLPFILVYDIDPSSKGASKHASEEALHPCLLCHEPVYVPSNNDVEESYDTFFSEKSLFIFVVVGFYLPQHYACTMHKQ